MVFRRGQSGNPKGRPPILDVTLAEEIKADKTAAKRLILLYLKMTPAQTQERMRKSDLSNLEHAIGAILERGINDGDPGRIRLLMEMAMGNMTDGPVPTMTEEETRVLEKFREWKAAQIEEKT